MRHDDKPQQVPEVPDDVLKDLDELTRSPYYRYVLGFKPSVVGKQVVGSAVFRAGFVLLFSDQSWAAAFVKAGALAWALGNGPVTNEVLADLDSIHTGDGTSPLRTDFPYADQRCDIQSELAHCHGQAVTGLAIGSDSFNFCFPNGMELDTAVIVDPQGRSCLRVFWEQW